MFFLKQGRHTAAASIQLSLLLIAAMFVSVPGAAAQMQNSGTVVGQVVDPQGNLVPHAQITLTSVERGQSLTVQSDDRGEYLFQSIKVGHYTLKVKAATFRTFEVSGIQVDADQNIRVDARMQVGDVSATVEVQASGNEVDTQSATLGLLIDPDLIHALPIDGNNVVSMAALLPGVVNVNAPTTFTSDTGGPTYSANGARNTENLFLLDGAIWNNLYYNTGLNYPPPDGLQEVSVLLNNFKAQYGRNVGSIFNAVTRAGSNQFHGMLYDYVQNHAFNAADYMSQINPKLVQNQFGGTVGGPLIKQKLFFFVSLQAFRAAQTATAQANTLSAEERGLTASGAPNPCSSTGAFPGQSCATNIGTLQNPLYAGNVQASAANALTALNAAYTQAGGAGPSPCVTELQSALTTYGRYVPNNELPGVCFNPVIVNILRYLPTPNLPSGLTGTQAPSPKNEINGLGRIDYQLGKHSLDARFYGTAVDDLLAKSTAPGSGIANYEVDRDTGATRFGEVNDTWIVRGNLLNVARVAYKRYSYNVMPTDPTTLADLGANFPTKTTVPELPQINDSGYFIMGSSSHGLTHTVNEDIELVDSVSWTKGHHNFQFGADYLRLQYQFIADTVPYLFFNAQYTTNYPADFLLGLMQQESFGNQLNRAGIQHDVYLYAQDDWRMSSRLTLNVGLRYELPFPYFQPNNQNSTFIPGFQSLRFPQAPPNLAFVGDPGVSRSLVPMQYNNLAPRFGFAYDLRGNGKTAIRGGVGLFYSATNALVIGVGEPFHYAATYSQPPGGISNPLLGLPAIPDNYDGKNNQFTAPYSIFFPDKNFKTGYTEAFNLGVQQAIHKRGVLAVNYVGRFGHHQPIPVDLNPAIYDCSGGYYQINPAGYCGGANTTDASYRARVTYPNFNYGGQGIVDYASIANSNYHALQALYTQRGMRGISVTTSFTYSKSMDEQSNGQTVSSTTPQPANVRSQYGPSDFNSKFNFTLGWSIAPTRIRFRNRLRMANRSLSNWTLSGLYSARTGSPFSITIPGDTALTGEPQQRARLVPQFPGDNGSLPSHRHRSDKVKEWFNTASFAPPATGTYSPLPRNTVTGPAYISNNVAVGRVFVLPHANGTKIDFRADAFNVTNTPNLSNPNSSTPSGTCSSNPSAALVCHFGQILTTAGTNSSVGTNGRRLQLSLKLIY